MPLDRGEGRTGGRESRNRENFSAAARGSSPAISCCFSSRSSHPSRTRFDRSTHSFPPSFKGQGSARNHSVQLALLLSPFRRLSVLFRTQITQTILTFVSDRSLCPDRSNPASHANVSANSAPRPRSSETGPQGLSATDSDVAGRIAERVSALTSSDRHQQQELISCPQSSPTDNSQFRACLG